MTPPVPGPNCHRPRAMSTTVHVVLLRSAGGSQHAMCVWGKPGAASHMLLPCSQSASARQITYTPGTLGVQLRRGGFASAREVVQTLRAPPLRFARPLFLCHVSEAKASLNGCDPCGPCIMVACLQMPHIVFLRAIMVSPRHKHEMFNTTGGQHSSTNDATTRRTNPATMHRTPPRLPGSLRGRQPLCGSLLQGIQVRRRGSRHSPPQVATGAH